jgi:alginate O-acetyltransferase complex protein AlgI
MVAKPIWTLGSIVVTFGFVCLTDIFFRANSVSDALYIISSVGNIDVFYVVDILYTFKSVLLEPNLWFNRLSFDFGSVVFQMTNGDFIMSLILIPTLLFVESRNLLEKIQLHSSARFFLFYLLAVSIILFGVLTEKQFIYFQF